VKSFRALILVLINLRFYRKCYFVQQRFSASDTRMYVAQGKRNERMKVLYHNHLYQPHSHSRHCHEQYITYCKPSPVATGGALVGSASQTKL